ncbi:hypothetical protein [Armatimonas sp.]|uniref:hypothetical protein n=1 Tax=Armatimonas sp. TaxID=1872638 RepID=UPI00375138CA
MQTEAPAPKPLRLPVYGLNAGTYLPTSAAVRARFGENWFSFSPGLGPVLPLPFPGLSPDFSLATQTKKVAGLNNRVFMALLGAQYQWPLFRLTVPEGQPLRLPKLLPYAGLGAGGVYANVRSEADRVNGSGFAPSASVYAGTSIGINSFFEARWRSVGRVQGFDLSGLDLGAGIRF